MARRRATGFIRDFQDFIKRGNVVDLAVAVVIGGAFGKIVDEVVKLITGALLNPVMQQAGVEKLADWPAGSVLVAIINFLVIAFVVFLIVRALESFKRQEEVAAGPDPIAVQQQLTDAINRLSSALESRNL